MTKSHFVANFFNSFLTLVLLFSISSGVNAQRTLTRGSAQGFSSAGSAWVHTKAIDETHLIVLYKVGTSSSASDLVAKIGTVDTTNKTVTWGATVTVESNTVYHPSEIVVLSPTKAVALYELGTVYAGHAKVLTLNASTNTITSVGASTQFANNIDAAFSHKTINAEQLSSTTFAVQYSDESNGDYGVVKIGTLSGSTLSFGSENYFATRDVHNFDMFLLSSSKLILTFEDDANLDVGKAIVGTISGTTVSFGSDYTFNSNPTSYTAVAGVSSDKAVMFYVNDDANDYAYAKVATISGTTITFSSNTYTVESGQDARDLEIDYAQGNEFVLSYNGGAGDPSKVRVGEVSGSGSGASISFGTAQTFLSGEADDSRVVSLNDNTIALAYVNETNTTDFGEVQIGTMPTIATVVGISITSSSNVSCNGGNDGSITATATPGVANYSYGWSNGATSGSTSATTHTISGLAAGTYTVTITDANSSTATASTTISQPNSLGSSASVTQVIGCNGGTQGQVTASGSGGTTPYTYSWNTGGTSAIETGLSAGTYSVTITDQNGCTDSSSITLSQPNSLGSSAAVTQVIGCNGGSQGQITASGSGGSTPYTYSWNTGGTSALETGLSAGTYSVTITDQNGCTDSSSITLSQPNSLGSSASVTQIIDCNGNTDGQITASGSGGSTPYTYSWNTGGTSALETGLSAGTYSVTITDQNGCTDSSSITLSQPNSLGSSASVTQVIGCNGGSQGQITASGSGGTSPYTYSWNTGGTSALETGLSAGTYSVTITDQNGCTDSSSITLSQPNSLGSSASVTQVIGCSGGNQGQITASGSGGSTPYTYSWNTGGTSALETGLSAGTYSVTITDQNGCTDSSSITLSQPNSLGSSASVTQIIDCNGDTDGQITASGSGGSTPYTYSWNTGGTSALETGLAAGTYSVTITDQNGCTDSTSITLAEPVSLDAGASVTTSMTCNGSNDGQLTASATGGSTPYTYSWNTGGTAALETSVAAGTYSVTITDQNGCTDSTSITLAEPVSLDAGASVTTPMTCNGADDGQLTASATGGSTPYTYTWNTGGTAALETSVAAGTYSVTITDQNGCTDSTSVTLTQPAALVANAAKDQDAMCGGTTGGATASASGGTTAYTYAWSNGATTAGITGIAAGTYSVTITDANGCTDSASVVISSTPGVTAGSVVDSNVSCNGQSDGGTTASGTGGSTPYTYTWSNGATTAATTGLSAGTYTVTITDQNGCTSTTSSTITQPAGLTAGSVVDSNITCNGLSDGGATASATGGTTAYTYAWSNSATTASITGVGAGTYSVTISDANGCTNSSSVTLTEPAAIVKETLTATDTAVCAGSATTVTTASSETGIDYTLKNAADGTTISGPTAGSGAGLSFSTGNINAATNYYVEGATNQSLSNSVGNALNFDGTDDYVLAGTGYTRPTNEVTVGAWIKVKNMPGSGNNHDGIVGDKDIAGLTRGYGLDLYNGNTIRFWVDGWGYSAQTTYNDTGWHYVNGRYGNGEVSIWIDGVKKATYAYSNSINFTQGSYGPLSGLEIGRGFSGGQSQGHYDGLIDEVSVFNRALTDQEMADMYQNSRSLIGDSSIIAYYDFEGGTGTNLSDKSSKGFDATLTNMDTSAVWVAGFGTSGAACPVNSDTVAVAINAPTTSSETATACNTYTWAVNSMTYTATGTYKDTLNNAAGCDSILTLNLTITPSPTASAVIDSNVSCNGLSDGGATASATGGTTAYTYTWSNTATTASITGVGAGTYSVTITDQNGCADSSSITLAQPVSLDASASVTTPMTCNGANDGQLTASATGGTTPYTYSWNTGGTTALETSLAAGTYSVTITDQNGCTDSSSVTLTQPTSLASSASVTTALDCNGDTDGQLTASGAGGTSPYTYSWNTGGTSALETGLGAGTYSVTITDQNGCTDSSSVTLSQPASLDASATVTGILDCNGDTDGQVTASGTGGTSPYTYAWNTGGTSALETGLGAGTYSVTITDQNGCTDSSSVTLAQPVALSAITTLDSNASCGVSADGGASVSGAGGTAPYTYAWSNSATTASITGIAAGTYSVTITDANGCSDNNSIVVGTSSTLTVGATIDSNVTCYGLVNGGATASGSQGAGTYTYSWSNSVTTASITGVIAGTYSVTVTDNQGCQAFTSATITEPALMVASASITSSYNGEHISCNGSSDGEATASGTGGTAPYNYSWDNSSTNAIASGLSLGSAFVTVTDANGCMAIDTVTLTEPPVLVATSTLDSNVSCNGDSDGGLTAGYSGGVGAPNYLWSNGATTASITGVAMGNYTVTVTDQNGCTASISDTITEPAALVSAVVVDSNVSCNGMLDGGAAASATGGTAPYTYAWSNSATTASITGVAAGTYSLTITDANGCSASNSVTITEPTALVASSQLVADASCPTASNGSALAFGAGGTSPFTYLWSDNSTNDTLSGVMPGTYSVTVSDANGCSDTSSVVVGSNSTLSAVASVTNNVSCFGGSDASAMVTVTGGAAPFSYSWSNSNTDSTISGLNAATYYVTVTDGNGCSDSASATITEPALLVASAAITSNYNGEDISCNGSSDGEATASATGGTTPHTYAWDNSSTNAIASGLSSGSAVVTITDANGCTDTASVSLIDPPVLVATSTLDSNVSCNGDSDGGLTAGYSGGVGAPNYLWSNGATTASITGVAMGNYTVTVTDQNGCTASISDTITEPAALVSAVVVDSNVSCNGMLDGGATASATGGTAPYTYAWSHSATTASITGVAAGTYSLTITDANGCSASNSVTITEPTALVASSQLVADASCPTASNGSALASGAGGTSPFTYLWSDNSTNDTLSGVMPGTYSVTVSDANGCSDTSSVVVSSNSTLSVTAGVDSNVSCYGGSNGGASLFVSGGATPFSYSWSNNDTTLSVTGLPTGTYSVTVTDGNSCTDTSSVMITEPTQIAPSVVVDSNASCNGATDGGASITASGGTGNLSFLWSTSDTSSSISGLGYGTFYVTTTDGNSCSVVDSVSISEPTVLASSVALNSNVLCNGDSTGSATVTATGGTTSYSYMWSNSSTNATLSNVPAGSYQVTVTDANGCTALDTVAISEPTLLTLTTSTDTNVSCNAGSNGVGSALVMGGVMPYTYSWSNSDTTASISGLMAGTYILTLTDSNSCSLVDSVVITEPTPIVLTTVVDSNVKCFATFTGGASAMSSGGSGMHNYIWSNGDTTSFITGVKAGNYTVTVTDSLNCTATSSVGIFQNAPIGARLDSVFHPECNTDSTGFIKVFTGAGAAPLSYSWSNGDTNRDLSNLTKGYYAITITDANGCLDSLNTTLLAIDTINPVIMTQSISIYLDNTGNVSLTAAQVDNGTYDNCGIKSISIDRTSFTCSDLGNNTINFTATDTSNNTLTQAVTITVVNNIAPTFSTFPSDTVICKADSSQLWYPASVLPGTDNCGNLASIKQVEGPTTPNYLPGVTKVGWEVSDRYGNKDTAYYTVTIQVVPNWGDFISGDIDEDVCNVKTLTFFTDTAFTKVNWYWTFRSTPALNTDTTDTVTISTPANDDILNLGVIVENVYGCVDSSGVEITYLATCVSIDEPLANLANINFYPNPNKGQFVMNTSGLSGNVSLRVTDVHGKLIEKFNWEEGESLQNINLELHDVESGIYFLTLEEARGVSIHRITIN